MVQETTNGMEVPDKTPKEMDLDAQVKDKDQITNDLLTTSIGDTALTPILKKSKG